MSSLLSSHPLLCRLDSASWRHPGFAPYWPLLRRLRQMAWEAAGRPDMTAWQAMQGAPRDLSGVPNMPALLEQAGGAQPEGGAPQTGGSGNPAVLRPADLPPETWDTAHWLPFMNLLAAWRGLRTTQGVPLRFVAGSDVGAVDYECSIREGAIPCKLHAEGARHDFHNALVWLRFPRLKAAINHLHCEQAARDAAAVGFAAAGQAGEGLSAEGLSAEGALVEGMPAEGKSTGWKSADGGLAEGRPGEGAASRKLPSQGKVTHSASGTSMKPRGRGPLRDALTLLDENGAIWPDPLPLWETLLAQRQWHALFVGQRQALLGGRMEVPEEAAHSVMMNAGARGGALGSHAPVIVGHGLLEKLHQPYKSMTAKLLACPEPRYSLDWGTARQLLALAKAGNLRPGLLQPLPVQGWPGWDPANADPAYYADEQVFRGLRQG